MPSTRSSKLSTFTVAEKEAIQALVELKKACAPLHQGEQQRPRRACTTKEMPAPTPRSTMDRPRRSNVQY